MTIINFHTHSSSAKPEVINIRSYTIDELQHIETNELCTVGIHPWFANEAEIEKQLDQLKTLLTSKNVIGLGEVGLDKLRGPDIEIQKQVLTAQLDIAYNLGKPVIIDCVKAWEEIFEVKKKHPNKIQWAIHGFNGNAHFAKQLIDLGFYLSVGHAIMNRGSKISSAISSIPLNKLFFENDDSNFDIEEILSKASDMLSITKEYLGNRMCENFMKFYGNSLPRNAFKCN